MIQQRTLVEIMKPNIILLYCYTEEKISIKIPHRLLLNWQDFWQLQLQMVLYFELSVFRNNSIKHINSLCVRFFSGCTYENIHISSHRYILIHINTHMFVYTNKWKDEKYIFLLKNINDCMYIGMYKYRDVNNNMYL